MQKKILIATSNKGKLVEIQAVMSDLPVQWYCLADFPPMPEVVEDGATFEANAEKKALHYAGHADMWTLADDSGLVVDALGGEPGVQSARYAQTGDDLDNNRKLISELSGVPQADRSARFVCCMVLARPGEVLVRAKGTIEGQIIDQPRGENGFGYDPHFWVPELKATTAELPPEHKNRISHRGKALQAIILDLQKAVSNYC